MEGANGKLNAKDLATSMAVTMLKHVRREAIGHLGPVIIEWAKMYGAKFTEEDKALLHLQEKIPDPINWPSVEVTASSKLVINNETPKPVRPGAKGKAGPRQLSDFKKVDVPDGVKAPTCLVPKKSGANKDEACGKAAKYALDEHDARNNPECRLLQCNHCFCGNHIKKMSSEDAAAYDALKRAADNNAKPSVIVGEEDTTINSNITNALPDEVGMEVGYNVMDKLMAKIQAKTGIGSE